MLFNAIWEQHGRTGCFKASVLPPMEWGLLRFYNKECQDAAERKTCFQTTCLLHTFCNEFKCVMVVPCFWSISLSLGRVSALPSAPDPGDLMVLECSIKPWAKYDFDFAFRVQQVDFLPVRPVFTNWTFSGGARTIHLQVSPITNPSKLRHCAQGLCVAADTIPESPSDIITRNYIQQAL